MLLVGYYYYYYYYGNTAMTTSASRLDDGAAGEPAHAGLTQRPPPAAALRWSYGQSPVYFYTAHTGGLPGAGLRPGIRELGYDRDGRQEQGSTGGSGGPATALRRMGRSPGRSPSSASLLVLLARRPLRARRHHLGQGWLDPDDDETTDDCRPRHPGRAR